MKHIFLSFLFLAFILFTGDVAISQNQRMIGGTQLDLDNNAGAHIFLTNALSSLGINATGVTPNTCALLDLVSTTKGLLVPRMTTAQELLICGGTPPEGLITYNTTTHTLDVYNGTIWGASGWALNGNNLTGGTSATPNQFLGSNNNFDVVLTTNSIERVRWGSSVAANVETVTIPATATNGIQVNGNAATTRGVNVDMSTNPVSTAGATAFNASVTGTAGNSVSGATVGVTVSGGANGTGLLGTSIAVSGAGQSTAIAGTSTLGGTANGLAIGVSGSGVAIGAGQTTGGQFNAFGGTSTNTGVLATSTGGLGTNIGVDVNVSGAGSTGVRVGASATPATGISVINATTTGISVSGAPTGVVARVNGAGAFTGSSSGIVGMNNAGAGGGVVGLNGLTNAAGTIDGGLSGEGPGVYGETIQDFSAGVEGVNSGAANWGFGVIGGASSGATVQAGVLGISAANTGAQNYAVVGEYVGGGVGVPTPPTTITNAAVMGVSTVAAGAGIGADNTAAGGIGLRAQANSGGISIQSTNTSATVSSIATQNIGNNTTTDANTNIALDVRGGEITIGRQADAAPNTNTDALIPAGENDATATVEGPSGVVDITNLLSPPAGIATTGVSTIYNRYVKANSIILLTPLTMPTFNQPNDMMAYGVTFRGPGFFIIALQRTNTTAGAGTGVPLTVRFGFLIINPTK
jgi:hypothetical protein